MNFPISAEQYRQLKEKGWLDRAIANSIFVSYSTFTDWKRKNGLTKAINKKVIVPLTIPEYLGKRREGKTDIEIASIIGVTPIIIYNWKSKHGLKSYREPTFHELKRYK